MIEIFEYQPLTRPRAIQRRLAGGLAEGERVVLDLEDSAMDVTSRGRTRELKALARTGLAQLSARLPGMSCPAEHVWIRINGVETPHYPADLIALREWCASGLPLRIALPKTESADCVRQCLGDLDSFGIRPVDILPLLESPASLQHIEAILDACPGPGRQAQFGFFDYLLVSGAWPFPEADTRDYWSLVAMVAERIESCGGRYVHFPETEIESHLHLAKIRAGVMEVCNRPPAFCTLNHDQTRMLASLPRSRATPPVDRHPDAGESAALARQTIDSFLGHIRPRRSFAMHKGRFIPPHEYLAACAYLKQSTT